MAPSPSPDIGVKIRRVEDILAQRVLGQAAATTEMAALINAWLCGTTERAPRLLLLGPTGVGKTASVEAASEAVHQRGPDRFDMSEYSEPYTIGWWLGDRSGDCGRLQPIVESGQRTILLLDEIEKADPKVIRLLLQMMEPGHLTLASGRRLDLRQIPIICTSNVASAALVDVHNLLPAAQISHVLTQAKKEMRPELLNRFDAAAVFLPLDVDHQRAVLQLHLRTYLEWLDERGFRLTSSPTVERLLMLRGFDRENGARPLRRAMRRLIGDAVVEDLRKGGCGTGELRVNQDKLVIHKPDDARS